jgi:formate-dependent nitrite reductase membrane component NrfD
VVVCPEHAIISGDMDDPDTEISQLLSREPTTVRKPEKGTVPNLYYIEGDSYSLMPTAAAPQEDSLWSSQSRGVGHFAKYTERLAWQGEDLVKELLQKSGNVTDIAPGEPFTPQRSIEVLTGKSAKNVYNTPDKGILWGWEVAAYVTTKAIATGTYMILLGNIGVWEANGAWWGLGITLAFLMITTGLLIKDLDQPGRFIYVLLRPQWRSWLVRGGYGLVLFSGLVVFQLFATAYKYWLISAILSFPGILLAAFVSIYTAFLFAQARGRDFWQSPLLPLHMLIHSLMAGSATFILLISSTLLKLDPFVQATVMEKLNLVLSATILINLLIMLIELTITHSTSDTKATIAMILKGRYRVRFWWVVVAGCNIVPLISLLFNRSSAFIEIICSTAVIAGIYLTERIWLEAPQRIPLA